MDTQTYTRPEAMQALGISSPNAFHSLRRRYPNAFKVVHQGTSKKDLTLYDKKALDEFIAWRQVSRSFDAALNDPLGFILNKKGKQS
jgi:hypothetical protein